MAELVSISIYTLFIAYTGVGNLRQWAEQRLLALPNERSSHSRPTPSGGGVAIVLSTLFGVTIFLVLTRQFSLTWGTFLFGAVLVACISWLDDLYTMPSAVRIAIHSASALCVVLGVGAVRQVTLPVIGDLYLGWLGYGLTFLWIIALINGYNFMDGLDGLAGTQAVIAGVTWTGLGYWADAPLIMALGLLLAASSLGFLPYNWPPARIFMGDVGSAFLGYTFAALAVLGAQHHGKLAFIGALVLWPFLFDTLFTLGRRWQRGENVFQAHRSHLYQRLVISGHSHRTVTLLYACFAAIGALAGIGWFWDLPGSANAIVFGLPTLAASLWVLVWYYETRPVKIAHQSS